jgi:hypothetical protein
MTALTILGDLAPGFDFPPLLQSGFGHLRVVLKNESFHPLKILFCYPSTFQILV